MSGLFDVRASHPLHSAWGRVRRQVEHFVLHFIEGDHSWGTVRLVIAFVFIFLLALASRLFEPVPPLPFFESLRASPAGDLLPAPLIALAEFFASFFTRLTLRHMVPAFLGFVVALYAGAVYLRDLLELPTLGPAFNFLTATLFGMEYPRLTIAEGKATVDNPATNPMLKIGGPGWVDIKLGNAALFERIAGPSSVLGAGTHFIRRFETLREAFDLREMERVKNDVRVYTKDGLPLVLNEFRVRFRMRTRGERTEATPFPVSPGAVRQAIYNRKVGEKGVEAWAEMVAGAAVGRVTGWIARRRMDELIPPPPSDVDAIDAAPPPYRKELHAIFQQKSTRQAFAEMGAEIVWVSVGHLRPSPDVDPDLDPQADPKGRDKIQQQIIETWKSWYEVLGREEIAETWGHYEFLQDIARAEVQADMITRITRGLREAHDAGVSVADLLSARATEYLAAITERAAGHERLRSLLLSTEKPPEASEKEKKKDNP
jgi:hypothetical protein